MRTRCLSQWIVIPALAALYFGASKLGLTMAFTAAQVSPVWPPTGIALAAVLLFGYRVWPGIAVGAFLANITTHEPIAAALGVTAGNTLEALAGAYMLTRFVQFSPRLDRLRDVLGLVVFSAFISTMLSATIGVTSLCLSGVQPWAEWRLLWLTWWIGDAGGALIVAPALLVWSRKPDIWRTPQQAIQLLTLIAGLVIICLDVFADHSGGGHAFIYFIFPFIILAAMCFGQHGTTLVTLAAAVMAIWATLMGIGPFTGFSVDQSLAALQLFMGTVAVTGLCLSAAISERRNVEKEIRESDRRKEEFLATLAHELRNPLAPMRHVLHFLGQPGNGDARRRESLNIMERQLQQMVRLVDDLLDVSRISHGKIELRREPVTLADTMEAAMETVRPLIEDRKHTLSVRLPEETLWLDADPSRLSQIFANLLGNAAKYTELGGKISLEAAAEEHDVTILIRDTGIGIAPEMLPKVFDMFAQGDTSISRVHGGLGIGLTLVKNLIGMHGGSVTATSRGIGMGSEFIVRLPLMPPPAAAASSPETSAALQERRLKVLVVDDHQTLAKTLGWMVESLGHDARVVHNGAEALAAACSYGPDVILLDIGLSGMSGYEVAEALRRDPRLSRCVLVAQTGWGQPEHRQRSKEAGFDHHLVKPVEIEALVEIFRSVPRAP